MATTDNQSFRRFLVDELAMYPRRSGPIRIDGKSEPYTRAIVSAYNTQNGRSYSVIKYGTGLLVGLRSDCRNYTPEPVAALQPAVDYAAMAGAELLALAVEQLRGEGRGGDEMRAALNALLTDNDDLL
jgi:hypothetical protein